MDIIVQGKTNPLTRAPLNVTEKNTLIESNNILVETIHNAIKKIKDKIATVEDYKIWSYNKQVMLEAVKNDGLLLQFVLSSLKDDKQFVIEILEINYNASSFNLSDIKNDADIIKLMKNDIIQDIPYRP